MTDGEAPRRRGRPPRLSVEERREAVLDAALELFATTGRSAVSVDAVAARAGVQKPSVYRLYPSKDELYRAAVAREVDRFTAWVDECYGGSTDLPLEDRIRARATGVVAHAGSHRVGMTLLVRALRSWPDEDLSVGVELRQRVLDVLARFATVESRRDGVDVGPAADAIAVITFGLTQAVVELVVEDRGWSTDALGELLAETTVAAFTRTSPAMWLAMMAPEPRRGTPGQI